MGRLENVHDYCNQILIIDNYFQLFYKVNINGVEIRNVENIISQSFEDVKVFAGDKFHAAADASYDNLMWESTGKQAPQQVNNQYDDSTRTE